MKQGMQSLVLATALGCALLPPPLAAASGVSPSAVRKQAESSMLVSGEVYIEEDGSVSRLLVDREEKLPPGVVKFVRDSARAWQFEPVLRDGRAVKLVSPMRLRVVAGKQEDGGYRISLRGVSFDAPPASDRERARMLDRTAPTFPMAAAKVGAAGTVYMLVKVGRDGHVEDLVAEQVNLRMIASEGDMARLRQLFADSSIDAARSWTFQPPTEGALADRPFWIVRVPVNFRGRQDADGTGQDDYGRWVSYVPGPRQRAPWARDTAGAEFSPDTLADGGVYMADGSAPKLRSPLQGS